MPTAAGESLSSEDSPPRMLGHDGRRVAWPNPRAVPAARLDGALQMVQITPQVADIEDFEPVPARRAVDLLDALDDLLLGKHWVEALKGVPGLEIQ